MHRISIRQAFIILFIGIFIEGLINTSNIQKLISYLAENTLYLH